MSYIHNLYIKLYLSKSKKREPNSKSYTPHVHSLWRSYESRKKNKKIRRDPSLVIWLDIYCPQNKMFVFCCDMYSCHCPPPNPSPDLFLTKMVLTEKMKQRIVRIKKAREIRAIFPSGPPHYSPTYFCYCGNLEIQRSKIERIFIWLNDIFRSKWKKHYEKNQIINSIFTKPSKHYVFSLAQPLVFSFLLIHFCYFTKRASSVKKETNLRMGNFFRH